MKKITPERFRDAFSGVVSSAEPSIRSVYGRSKDLTALMRSDILPAVAEKLGLKCYSDKDYYWLDAIFCEEYDLKNFPGKKYARNITVAIEHENDIDSTASEMNKLQIYNASLKVLITYCTYCDHDVDLDYWLPMYTDIVEGADVFSDFSTKRRQLVVFGTLWNGDELLWRYFLYDGSGFVKI